MSSKKKISVAYTKYVPQKQTWNCYDKADDKIVGLNDFTIIMMKGTKKFKPFYLKGHEIDQVKSKHSDLKTLRLYTLKDKAYQHLKDRSIKKEIEHPFSNNGLFIDCYLNYYTEQMSDDLEILGPQDIQSIAKAVDRIFKSYRLNKRVNPIIKSLNNKQISMSTARYKIEQSLSGRVIRYIPFGSPLQKTLTKAIEKAHCSYRQVFGGCNSNMFGFFYFENKNHNIMKRILSGHN